jgi:hypothetical protein
MKQRTGRLKVRRQREKMKIEWTLLSWTSPSPLRTVVLKKKKKKNPFLAIYKDPVPSCDLSTLKATFPLGQKKALTPM